MLGFFETYKSHLITASQKTDNSVNGGLSQCEWIEWKGRFWVYEQHCLFCQGKEVDRSWRGWENSLISVQKATAGQGAGLPTITDQPHTLQHCITLFQKKKKNLITFPNLFPRPDSTVNICAYMCGEGRHFNSFLRSRFVQTHVLSTEHGGAERSCVYRHLHWHNRWLLKDEGQRSNMTY